MVSAFRVLMVSVLPEHHVCLTDGNYLCKKRLQRKETPGRVRDELRRWRSRGEMEDDNPPCPYSTITIDVIMPSLSPSTTYIYIYIEIERERERLCISLSLYIYIYIKTLYMYIILSLALCIYIYIYTYPPCPSVERFQRSRGTAGSQTNTPWQAPGKQLSHATLIVCTSRFARVVLTLRPC